jgi:D-beta-D-heptose 7-phosphate kinase / D-beta-D-heptose 1-phosphate adenosyltransferase
MSHVDLLRAFDRLSRPRVMVLGDLILDRYTWGNAERVSQEAPVILLRADRREARLGGAANVCHMLRGLEAQTTCLGIVGADADGSLLRRHLLDSGVDETAVLVDRTRPTTVKERFMGRAANRHPHQILRVDSEVREPICQELEDQLLARVVKRLRDHDMLLISDYDKGVCTTRILREAIDAATRAGVRVVVDPIRGADYQRYHGATTMTPNRLEAELATSLKINTPDDAFRAGERLCRTLGLAMAIVTLDRDGMALVWPDGQGELFPTRARAVYDITGAGDMVLAMIGVALAAGTTPEIAIQLGNMAAGIEVEKIGVAQVSRDEIRGRLLADQPDGRSKVVTIDELERVAIAHRARGESIVFTNGCFDLLHVGHVSYLQEAARMGDHLVVGLNTDASVRRLKGPSRPVINETDRAAILAALACVSQVVLFDADTPHELLRRLRPDVLVKGGTYQPSEVVGQEVVEEYGGRVCVTGMVDGISTSAIVASLAENQTLRGPHAKFTRAPRAAGTTARPARETRSS